MPDSADILHVAGVIAVVLCFVAWLGDRRRMRRSDPDAVGCMPWTSVFFFATILACVLLGLWLREWIAGG